MQGICCHCQSKCDVERIVGGAIVCSPHDAFGSPCDGVFTVPQVVFNQDDTRTQTMLEIMGDPIDLHTFPDIEEAERDQAWGLGRKH